MRLSVPFETWTNVLFGSTEALRRRKTFEEEHVVLQSRVQWAERGQSVRPRFSPAQKRERCSFSPETETVEPRSKFLPCGTSILDIRESAPCSCPGPSEIHADRTASSHGGWRHQGDR